MYEIYYIEDYYKYGFTCAIPKYITLNRVYEIGNLSPNGVVLKIIFSPN